MAGADWFVTLEGVEQGPLDAKAVKELVAAGMIGPMTPIRREGMGRAVCAAQVKGLLPPELVAESGVGGPASVSERTTAATAAKPADPDHDQLTDSGAQRVRGSVPSTRRMAVASAEPDSRPVRRAARAQESPVEDPDTAAIDGAELDAGIEARAGFGKRAAARLIDNVVVGLIVLIFVVGGVSIGSAIPSGKIEELNLMRETQETSEGDPLGTFQQWQETFQYTDPGERPIKPVQADGESVEAYEARISEYNEASTQYDYDLDTYNWRKNRYEGELPMVEAAIQQGLVVSIVGVIIGTLLALLYLPLTEGAFGASPGKKLLGLAVADADLNRVRMGPAILRQLLRLIPFGFLAALRANRLALHDQLSATQVVPAQQVRAPTKRAKRGGGGRGARQTKSGTARVSKSGTARATKGGGRRRR